jgi:myo-inositol-1(or 4)-monophosphatase
MNGEKIRVSKIEKVSDSLLSTGFPYDLRTSKNNNIDHFIRCLLKAQAVRRDGSAALNLAYVACGRFEGHWELKLNPWDMAAGYLLVVEAGGTVTTMAGKEFTIYEDSILATNGLIHREMLSVLGGGDEGV